MVRRVMGVLGFLVFLLAMAGGACGQEYKDFNAVSGIGKFYIMVMAQDEVFGYKLKDLAQAQILENIPNASFADSVKDADCMVSIVLVGDKTLLNVSRSVRTLRGSPPLDFWATIYMVERQVRGSDPIDSVRADLVDFVKWLSYYTK